MSRKTNRKLRLQLDALKVESFAPAQPHAERGTVRGYASEDTCYYQYTCNPYQDSCYATCQHIETCLEFC